MVKKRERLSWWRVFNRLYLDGGAWRVVDAGGEVLFGCGARCCGDKSEKPSQISYFKCIELLQGGDYDLRNGAFPPLLACLSGECRRAVVVKTRLKTIKIIEPLEGGLWLLDATLPILRFDFILGY